MSELPPDLEDLRKSLTGSPKEGWSKSSGVSPLKAQLSELVSHLKDLRKETEAQHADQLKKLDRILRHSSKHSSNRVKK